MSWTAPRTFVTAEVVTASIMNTHVRDNLLETAPAKATAAGDIFVATAANAIKRLVLGSAGKVAQVNSAGNDVEWSDNILKFPVAGGTGTAITVTTGFFTLTDQMAFTFVASADNSGAATTLNADSKGAKSLYKPGGTDAPTIMNGRAYTVWYDLSGDCFFVKAGVEVAGGTTMNFLACSAGSGDTKSTGATSYTKLMSCVVGVDGIYRVVFNLATTNAGATAYGRVYKNGVAYGTERSNNTTGGGVQYSEDLSFSGGDSIEIYGKISATYAATVSGFLIKNSTSLFYYTKY